MTGSAAPRRGPVASSAARRAHEALDVAHRRRGQDPRVKVVTNSPGPVSTLAVEGPIAPALSMTGVGG